MTYQFTNDTFVVESDKVTYTQDAILSNYMYETSEVIRNGTSLTVRPKKTEYVFNPSGEHRCRDCEHGTKAIRLSKLNSANSEGCSIC